MRANVSRGTRGGDDVRSSSRAIALTSESGSRERMRSEKASGATLPHRVPCCARNDTPDSRLHPDPALRARVAVNLRVSLVRIHHLADIVLRLVEIDRRQEKVIAGG